MASSDPLVLSDEHSYYSRLIHLLTNGGTLVLKEQFDSIHPPRKLYQKLQLHWYDIDDLCDRRVISDEQYNKLMSPNVKSSDFDISLLACLLRSICGFQSYRVWRTQNPSKKDHSLPADVVRLKNIRNEMCHKETTTLDANRFQSTWSEIETILLRQGKGVNNLQKRISDLKTANLDKGEERRHQDALRKWEFAYEVTQDAYEKTLQEISKQIDKTIVDKLTKTGDETTTLKEHVVDQINGMRDLRKDVSELECSVTQTPHPHFALILERSKRYVKNVKENGPIYIETNIHREAVSKLALNPGFVVLCGEPGDGKTSMAVQLLLQNSDSSKILQLSKPKDWDKVDTSNNLFDSILIDDIFGRKEFQESNLKKWRNILPDILCIAKRNGIKVVITTRPYILKEGQENIKRLSLFDKDQIVMVMSGRISLTDKRRILYGYLMHHHRKFSTETVNSCLERSGHSRNVDTENTIRRHRVLTFGYPQCVSLFSEKDVFYDKGPLFFSHPFEYVRKYVRDLFEDDAKFAALVFLWSSRDQKLHSKGFHYGKLREIMSSFAILSPMTVDLYHQQFDLFIEQRVSVLGYLVGSVTRYSSETYTFSHPLFYDVIGVVLIESQYRIAAVIKYCKVDFLVAHFSEIKDAAETYHSNESFYTALSNRVINIVIKKGQETLSSEVKSGILRSGRRLKSQQTCVTTTHTSDTSFDTEYYIDIRIFEHKILKNEQFISFFINYLHRNWKHEHFFETTVIRMTETLFGSGIALKEPVDICLIGYCLLKDLNKELTMSSIKHTLSTGKGMSECFYTQLQYGTMFAIERNDKDLFKFLLEHGAEVTGDTVYIAAHVPDMYFLTSVLKQKENVVNECGQIVNGNTTLMVAARKGFINVVRLLLENGAKVETRNKNGLTALYIAAEYKQLKVCDLLIEYGADMNQKVGKFGRAPLHMAADFGYLDVVQYFIEKGACTKRKDKRGHGAIHCAAMQGHVSVIKYLLNHDITLANQKATSYGKKSQIKGFTVFHLAAWKNDLAILQLLLELELKTEIKDCFGRTPVYLAAFYEQHEALYELMPVANLNVRNKEGMSPLHAAVCKGSFKTLTMLCHNRRVDINAQMNNGQTALHLACKKRNFVAIEKLINRGADWTISTFNGDTVFESEKMYTLYREKNSVLQIRSMMDIARNKNIQTVSNKEDVPNVLMNVIASTDPLFSQKLKIIRSYSKEEFSIPWLTNHYLFKFVVVIVVYLLIMGSWSCYETNVWPFVVVGVLLSLPFAFRYIREHQ